MKKEVSTVIGAIRGTDLHPRHAEFVRVWGLATLVVVIGFVITYQYVGAAPPKVIRIATGIQDGAYYSFGQRYARLLARDGITLEVVPTAGSVENLALLKRGDVSLALVQGGSVTDDDRQQLQSLGSLFLEPMWVFTRSGMTIHRFSELGGKRVAVGAKGSGTHALATQLLMANGITDANAALIRADGSETVRLLVDGQIDAAIFVASPEARIIRSLLAQPGTELLDLTQATAYSRLFPFLAPVILSEGVMDLARNIPSRDTRLVAASASLAARKDLNANLIPALLDVVTRVHEPGGIFEQRSQFPSVDFVDLPVNEEAAHYLRNGPSLLFRWLPYRTAVLLDRLKLLLLPFVVLLIPLFRLGPPLYQWRVRSRIYQWYAAVREIDLALLSGTTEHLATISNQLRLLEHEVASVSVPLSYAVEQYHLRLHIRFLEESLNALKDRMPKDVDARGIDTSDVSARIE